MEDICWTEALSVGNRTIDNDHRHLFGLLARVRDEAFREESCPITPSVFEELVAYTEEHFRREEAFMVKMGYPGYEEHKAQHEYFFSEVHALKNVLTRIGRSGLLQAETLLTRWLQEHVLIFDKALADYLKEHGVNEDDPFLRLFSE